MIDYTVKPEGHYLTTLDGEEPKISVGIITARRVQLTHCAMNFMGDERSIVLVQNDDGRTIYVSAVSVVRANGYFGNKVMSIRAFGSNDAQFSLGIVTPGNWNFGKTETKESIRLLTGTMNINSQPLKAGDDPIIIGPDSDISIAANSVAIYLCDYG